jgi:hypothetical protein
MNSVMLTPVAVKGFWRVKMTWPNKSVHFFGKFLSRAEAEKWIEQHRWLTEQPQEPGADEPQAFDDLC